MVQVIKKDTEYKQALERIENLMSSELNYEKERELELLGHFVDKYEREHYPIDYHDPVSAIQYRMQDLGFQQKDLAKIIGFHSKVSEVMNNKRRQSIPMILALCKHLNLPAEIL